MTIQYSKHRRPLAGGTSISDPEENRPIHNYELEDGDLFGALALLRRDQDHHDARGIKGNWYIWWALQDEDGQVLVAQEWRRPITRTADAGG